MRVFAVSLSLALAVLVAASCASTHKTKARKKLGPPPETPDTVASSNLDAHLKEVKESAAQQLECPIDQVTVQCVAKDRENECISVRATGCDKTLEMQFGTE